MSFSLPFLNQKKDKEVYLGIFLKETEIVGFVLEKQGDHLEVLLQEQTPFTNGWDTVVEDIDELLFSLEQKTKKHLEQVIFFVYSHFIDQNTNNIKNNYLITFKTIVKHLELKPLGYVECYEAVANHLEKVDQSPLTAILVELDKSNIGVFIYKGGHKSFVKITLRSESITDDLEAIFSDAKGEMMLPSRIVLYDSYDLHDESSIILSHKWNSELFVQYPRVEIIKPQQLHHGLIHIFQEQIMSNKINTEEKPKDKEVMGFVIGGDVEDLPEDKRSVPVVRNKTQTFYFRISILKTILMKITEKLRFSKLGHSMSRNYLTVIIGLLLIVSVLFLFEYLFHKVSINVLFPSNTLSKSIDIVTEADEKSDDSFLIRSATVSAEFSDKKNVTGKRDVGEKARGEVTLNNFSDKDRVFNKGTVIENSNIKFVLDDDVKVASASSTSDQSDPSRKLTIAGKGKVKVTAADLGAESNLSKGQKFKISELSLSDFFGINDVAFTGGSKKQIKTVSKQDIEDLKKSVLEKAEKEFTEKRKEESTEEGIFESLTSSEINNIKLSKEIGEEADEVSAKATVDTNYYVYSPKDVKSFLKELFKKDITSGFQLAEDKISFKFEDVEKIKGKISVNLDATALVMKDVSKSDVLNKIRGKGLNKVEKTLKSDFKASGYEIRTKVPLFIFDYWMPIFQKNIDIKISSL